MVLDIFLHNNTFLLILNFHHNSLIFFAAALHQIKICFFPGIFDKFLLNNSKCMNIFQTKPLYWKTHRNYLNVDRLHFALSAGCVMHGQGPNLFVSAGYRQWVNFYWTCATDCTEHKLTCPVQLLTFLDM